MKLKHLLIVSIFASILLTVPSLHRPFFSRGEPREALVAVGMLRTGEWISPPAYDNTVPSKPPFTHWLMAAFSVVSGGVSEVTTRLPSALSVFLFIPLLVAAIFRRYGAARALAVGLILLTTPEWYRAMISCRVDTVLATSVAGALLALFSWYERGRIGVPWLVILLLSIATLTKGPVGFCLPGAIFALFLWVKGEVRTRSPGTLIINVVTIMLPVLGVASVWYLLGYLERGDIFLEKVWSENFERLSGTMVDDPHDHPAPHLWFTTLLGLIPWCIFPVLALFRLRLGTILVHAKNWWRESDDFTKFNVIGVLFTLVLFSIPTSKRAVYILPAFPSIAFLISGLILKGGIPGSSVVCIIVSWASKIVSVFTLGASLTLLCGGLGVIPSGAPDGYFGRLSASALSGFSDPVWWGEVVVVCIFAGWCVFNLKGFGQYYREVATPEIRAGVTFLIAVALVNTFLMTIIAPALSVEDWIRSKDFQEKVKLSSYSKAYSFGSESYESSFYTGLPFERILPERCQREGLVFLEKRHQEKLRETCGVLVTPITQFQPFDGKPSRALVVGTLSVAK